MKSKVRRLMTVDVEGQYIHIRTGGINYKYLGRYDAENFMLYIVKCVYEKKVVKNERQ